MLKKSNHKTTGSNIPKVIIVLPAYNAEKTLIRTYQEIPRPYRKHTLLVDDCSSDYTVRIAKRLKLKIIRHHRNQGYGANQKTCYREALKMGADIVVMLHPDHQYNAKIIPQLVKPIVNRNCDACFGSRMLGGKSLEGGMPYWKYSANVILTAIANLIFKRYLTEIHSGFRAYSHRYLSKVRFQNNRDDFVFDTEIIAQGMSAGMKIMEIPIVTRYFSEASSIDFKHSVIYGFGVLLTLLKYLLHQQRLYHQTQFDPKKTNIK